MTTPRTRSTASTRGEAAGAPVLISSGPIGFPGACRSLVLLRVIRTLRRLGQLALLQHNDHGRLFLLGADRHLALGGVGQAAQLLRGDKHLYREAFGVAG